ETTRTFMEPRFGHDFSRVRVHADGRAAESARSVNALAYTVGEDLVFGAGQYAPGTSAGKRLLAHELSHVVQQEQGMMSEWPTGLTSLHSPTEQTLTNVNSHLADHQHITGRLVLQRQLLT